MRSFEKRITVAKDDLDNLMHVNNVRYLSWVQDISKEHWQTAATKEMQDNFIWVVSTHYLEYKAAAVLNDEILIKTYIEKSEGAISTRIVKMFYAETGKPVMNSKTDWCLLNAKSLRPMRIPEEIKNMFS